MTHQGIITMDERCGMI